MAFYIYNPKTYKRLYNTKGSDVLRASTERAAKGLLTKSGVSKDEWEVISVEKFYADEPYVTVNNLMSGKPVQIKVSERGGCCDPSTERYWSM